MRHTPFPRSFDFDSLKTLYFGINSFSINICKNVRHEVTVDVFVYVTSLTNDFAYIYIFNSLFILNHQY